MLYESLSTAPEPPPSRPAAPPQPDRSMPNAAMIPQLIPMQF